MVMQTTALKAAHDIDPAIQLMESAKALLDGYEPVGHDVLLLVYQRPSEIQFKSGVRLALPDSASMLKEDQHQGIVHLVAKLGPNVAERCEEKGLRAPKIGEWVLASIRDCRSFLSFDKVAARAVEAQMIWGYVDRPDLVS